MLDMAYPIASKEKFVELRASGMTLAKAAEELGIAYNTGSRLGKSSQGEDREPKGHSHRRAARKISDL
jgi:orotate phosphoribosyltransferase-like protein